MKDIVIAGYARSPFHFATKGALTKIRPDDLAAHVVKGLVERTSVNPDDVEDLILGCAFPEGEQGFNMARLVGLMAGLPISVAGTTGVREAVPTELAEQLADLRSRTDLPLAVGFGISEADHVVSLKGIADGAIVGSALVSQLESIAVDAEDRQVVLERVGDWISELVAAAGS